MLRQHPYSVAFWDRPTENLTLWATACAKFKLASQLLSVRVLDHARVGTRIYHQARVLRQRALQGPT